MEHDIYILFLKMEQYLSDIQQKVDYLVEEYQKTKKPVKKEEKKE